MKKRMIAFFMAFSLTLLLLPAAYATQNSMQKTESHVVVVLDAGHGGTENGASYSWNGTTVREKDLNFAIAQACKAELETYVGVAVYMTRTGDSTVSLADRASYAASVNADIMVSFHNNAVGPAQSWTDGAEALIPNGNYRPELTLRATTAANSILTSLHNSVGIVNRGLIQRNSSSSTYPNGTIADYYGLIRNAINQGVACTIVEHAFLDDANDYSSYLSDANKLNALGIADARGIAAAYGLKKVITSADNGDTPFVDVLEGAWYYDNVTYAYQNSLVQGTSTTTFEPETVLTRAMVVQILYNREKNMGTLRTDGTPIAFTDVPVDAWYTDAVNWASRNGIADGIGNGLFAPDASVTREQLAKLLYSYSKDTEVNQNLSAFPDANAVSSWAEIPMQWAVSRGIINGDTQPDGTLLLRPRGDATRAQAAAMMQRFFQLQQEKG